MRIAPELLSQIVDHALEDPKIECCGLVAVELGPGEPKTATRVYRATNVHASALKFEIDPIEQLKLTKAIEEQGWEIGAIYHSHVRTEPKPSQTDITYANNAGSIEWIIVGLTPGAKAEVRSYRIEDARVSEIPLEVR